MLDIKLSGEFFTVNPEKHTAGSSLCLPMLFFFNSGQLHIYISFGLPNVWPFVLCFGGLPENDNLENVRRAGLESLV